MAENKIHLRIITPFDTVFEGDVASLRAPGLDGSFGVLPHHAPFVAALQVGEIKVSQDKGELYFATSGGFAEVLPASVTMLVESAESVKHIDEARAKSAEARARKRLDERGKDVDTTRAEAALARAVNRLKVRTRPQ